MCRRVGQDGDSVAAVAAAFGVGWHTAMGTVVEHGVPVVDDPDRLGAPTDMAYQLFTAEKNQSVVEGDDNPETLNPLKFFTKSSDPSRFTTS